MLTILDAFGGMSKETIRIYQSWRWQMGGQRSRTLANGLRRCTWHQQLRRSVGAPGVALLSLAPHSFRTSKSHIARLARRYFLVMPSFIASGILHASGSWASTRAQGLPLSHGGEVLVFPASRYGAHGRGLCLLCPWGRRSSGATKCTQALAGVCNNSDMVYLVKGPAKVHTACRAWAWHSECSGWYLCGAGIGGGKRESCTRKLCS